MTTLRLWSKQAEERGSQLPREVKHGEGDGKEAGVPFRNAVRNIEFGGSFIQPTKHINYAREAGTEGTGPRQKGRWNHDKLRVWDHPGRGYRS